MYTCRIENSDGEIKTLTQNEANYQIVDIQGLNPPKAQINRSTVGGLAGSKFNSSRLEERNIVVMLKLNGDVEANRIELYRFFNASEWCKFHYTNGSRNVYIEGYVETNEVELFTDSEIMQVSIICPDPYFKDAQLIVDDISKIVKRFYFPFSIEYDDPIPFSEIEIERITDVFNASESKCGIEIVIDFIGSVNRLEIKNVGTNETFTIVHPFLANDVVTLVTNEGRKSINLNRNGVINNLFPKVVKGSVFFQLNRGDNYFSYLADYGDSDANISIVYKHNTLYRGV
jgi:hypothetical protein